MAIGDGASRAAAKFSSLSLNRQVGLLVGLAASIAIGIGVVLWSREPSYTPLFSQLNSRDSHEVVDVLQRNGFEVHFPREQTCCGAAQWHTGDEALAKKLARQNIDAFMARDYVAIVNNAGGCGLTLEEYPCATHSMNDNC